MKIKIKNLFNAVLTIVLILDAILLIISSSILIPCIDRNFYYIQIDNLDIVSDTNSKYSKESIIEAYDDLLDFIWNNDEFSVGSYNYSEEGKSHFEDCKKLFLLDLYIFVISLIIFAVILVLNRFKITKLYYFNKFNPIFYSGIFVIVFGVIIGISAITNFDLAFKIFHLILFPGKDNWMFNPYEDEVINILTEEYFMSCAALIIGLIIIECSISIIYGIKKKKTNI